MKKLLTAFATAMILLVTTILAFGQPAKNGVDKSRKKNLVYYWLGRSCPTFADTETMYGFKIECCGCISTRKIERDNRRVVRHLDKLYGRNWFEDNKEKFLKAN